MACRGMWWKATVAAAWGAREEERPSGKQAQTVLKMLTFHALTGLQPVSTGWPAGVGPGKRQNFIWKINGYLRLTMSSL